MKKIYTTALLSAAVLAGAAFGPTVVNAQTTEDGSDATDETTPNDRGMRGPRGDKGAAVAEVLGLTQDEVREAMKSGSTVADLAAANGVDIQTVIDAIVADMAEHIDEHVADGDLTAEEAAEKLDSAEERATDIVNGIRPEGGEGRGGRGGPGGGPGGEALAEALGLTQEEVGEALRSGSTIADLASANGVDINSITDGIVAQATERINEAVADGKLSTDEAAEKLVNAEERATDIVNGVRPEGGEGRGGHGPRPGAPADAEGADA